MGGIHIAEALRIPYYRAFTVSLLADRTRHELTLDALDPNTGIPARLRRSGAQARRSLQLHDVYDVRPGLLARHSRSGQPVEKKDHGNREHQLRQA